MRKEERNVRIEKQKTVNKMATVSPYPSLVTLSVKALNFPIRRQRASGFLKSRDPDPTVGCLQSLRLAQDTRRLQERAVFLEWNQPRAGMVVLKSDNRDFQTRSVIGDREGRHVVTKGLSHQEDQIIVSLFALSISAGACKYTKYEQNGETDRSCAVVPGRRVIQTESAGEPQTR